MYLDIEKYTHHDFPTNPSIIIRFFSAHNRNIPNMDIATMMTSSSGNIFRITNHLCGNSLVTGEIPTQMPVMRSFDIFFDLRLNERLSKQSWGWWFELPSHPLWSHSDDMAL